MELIQLVYASRPFGFDEGILNGILFDARENNARSGITGALICRADLYLQMLEGPVEAVEAAYGRILHDDRHLDVHLLLRGAAEARMFPDWAMRDDEARSWMWTMDEVAGGAVQRAAPAEVLAIFRRLAGEPPLRAAASAPACGVR